MKKALPKILLLLAIGGVSFLIYAVVRSFIKGERTLKGLLLAPFTTAQAAWGAVSTAAGTVADNVSTIASLPSQTATETGQHNSSQADAFNDYAPGGRIYLQIQAMQGTAAADAAWQKVQADYKTEQDQVNADSSWWGLGNLFSY